MSTVSYQSFLIDSPECHEKLKALYKTRSKLLSKPAYYLLSSIYGSKSLSIRFFNHLFAFNAEKYLRNPNIPYETIKEASRFVKALKKEVFGAKDSVINEDNDDHLFPSGELPTTITNTHNVKSHHQDNPDLQVLVPSIWKIIDGLSTRPKSALKIEFKKSGEDVKAFYSFLKPKLNSSSLLYGIGKGSYEETRKAISLVVNLVEAKLKGDVVSLIDSTAVQSSLESKQYGFSNKSQSDLQILVPLILERINGLPTRTKNAVLKAFSKNGEDVEQFVSSIKNNINTGARFDGVGTRSMIIVSAFYNDVLELYSQAKETVGMVGEDQIVSAAAIPEDIEWIEEIPSEVEYLYPYFIIACSPLSPRATYVIQTLFDECDHSLVSFYSKLKSKDFSIPDLHNYGQKTLQAVSSFISTFVSSVESFLCEEAPIDYKTKAIRMAVNELTKDELTSREIAQFAEIYGYFPFFKAINAIVNSFPKEAQFLLKTTTSIFNDRESRSLQSISVETGQDTHDLSRLRTQSFRLLQSNVMLLGKAFAEGCCYRIGASCLVDEINGKENTFFSESFVNWTICVLFPDYILVGNVNRMIKTCFRYSAKLSLFPSRLVPFFSLHTFLAFMGGASAKRYREVYTIPLDETIDKCLNKKRTITDDIKRDIEKWGIYLIEDHFNLVVEGGLVFFKRKKKNLRDIAYTVLKENGHAMTADQLTCAIQSAYPDRQFSTKSIVQAIRLHSDISTIGRSGTYTLKEWQDGPDRGGTIRSFVSEYLNSLNDPIATLKDVEAYVKRFRPETNQRSIQYNLRQNADNFRIFIYNEERYVGFSYISYSPKYTPYENTVNKPRSSKESLLLLIQFIANHSRFPSGYKTAPKEERRLAHAYYVQRSNYKNGIMSEQERIEWERFEERYRKYKKN